MKFVQFPAIVGPTYTLTSPNAECQRCVNMYVETIESAEGKNTHWLKPTPGYQVFCDLVDGPVKRLYTASNNRVFAIASKNVYELFVDGSKILRGSFGTTTPNHVRVSDNGTIMFLVFDTTAYVFNFGSNLLSALADGKACLMGMPPILKALA